jgi:hypothetical protein
MAIAATCLVVGAAGCGSTRQTSKVCRSVHENPVLFDKVLIGGEPVSKLPESINLTPATIVTSKLGKPDETLYLKDNVLFAWWRYGNTAYLIASLSANRPGQDYIAAKSCNWKETQRRARSILRNFSTH